MREIKPVEYGAQVIMTTEQISGFYECDRMQIIQNFNNNKAHFIEGKHYFKVEGEELKKLRVENIDMQISPMTRTLYLWTKRGCARHAKMLGTEKAWEVFEELEENYFSRKKAVPSLPPISPAVLVNEIGLARESIQKVFGVKEGIALAKATSLVEEFYNWDLSPLKKLIPSASHEAGTMTATIIGQKLGGISGKKVNKKLLEKGFMVKEGKGEYKLTAKGAKYGELMPYERHGHSGYQILWNEGILKAMEEV